MQASAERFFYRVRPSLSKWEVTFGDSGNTFLYTTQEEAIGVATGAAKLHWETRGLPSGVALETPECNSVLLVAFG